MTRVGSVTPKSIRYGSRALKKLYKGAQLIYTEPVAGFGTDWSEYPSNISKADWPHAYHPGISNAGLVFVPTSGTLTGRPAIVDSSVGSGRAAARLVRAGDIADVEVAGLVLYPDASQQFVGRLMVRGSGASGSENGYFTDVTTNTFQLAKYVNGTLTTLVSAPYTMAAGDRWLVRLKALGTNLKVKRWRFGTTEPTVWLFDVTDTSLSSGWIGLGRSGFGPVRHEYFSYSTSGSAPLP